MPRTRRQTLVDRRAAEREQCVFVPIGGQLATEEAGERRVHGKRHILLAELQQDAGRNPPNPAEIDGEAWFADTALAERRGNLPRQHRDGPLFQPWSVGVPLEVAKSEHTDPSRTRNHHQDRGCQYRGRGWQGPSRGWGYRPQRALLGESTLISRDPERHERR